VLGVADRIAVMRQGRIAAIVDRGEASETGLLKLALPLETAPGGPPPEPNHRQDAGATS
jgi:hypothetical protein